MGDELSITIIIVGNAILAKLPAFDLTLMLLGNV